MVQNYRRDFIVDLFWLGEVKMIIKNKFLHYYSVIKFSILILFFGFLTIQSLMFKFDFQTFLFFEVFISSIFITINLLENNNWAIRLINLQITLIILFLLSIILKKFLYYGNFSNSKNLIIFGIYLLFYAIILNKNKQKNVKTV